jgi:hypothetical protein
MTYSYVCSRWKRRRLCQCADEEGALGPAKRETRGIKTQARANLRVKVKVDELRKRLQAVEGSKDGRRCDDGLK